MYSSKPLIIEGLVVEDFCFTLKDGQIVDIKAKKNEEVLRDVIGKDPNNAYFGEVALVPHYSSISNLNLIFFDSLFDENAACHIAFGRSFPKCFENGVNMSREELAEKGLNHFSCGIQ